MSLSSAQLDAFLEVSRLKSFSRAATSLCVTQSALSQRIANLEDELGTTLFIRGPSGLRLTEVGEELLQYCKTREGLESECVARIKNAHSDAMVGVVRIAAYSTLMRSVVLPSMSGFLREHPQVRFEFSSREMRELPAALRSGEADFVFVDHMIESDKIHTILIGHEEYVLIESKHQTTEHDVYLDHDAEDQTTLRFFERQRKKPKHMARSFLDEIYTIIDGVASGLGRAVVPLHIVKDDKRVRRVPKLEPLLIPVYLSYSQQSVYTTLHKAIVHVLQTQATHLLRR